MSFLFFVSCKFIVDILQHTVGKVVLDPISDSKPLFLSLFSLNYHVLFYLFEYVPFMKLKVFKLMVLFINLPLVFFCWFHEAFTENASPSLSKLSIVHIGPYKFAWLDKVRSISCRFLILHNILFILLLDKEVFKVFIIKNLGLKTKTSHHSQRLCWVLFLELYSHDYFTSSDRF